MQNKNLILYIIIAVLLVILIGGSVYLFVIKQVDLSDRQGNKPENKTEENQITINWDAQPSEYSAFRDVLSSILGSRPIEDKEITDEFFDAMKVYRLGVVNNGDYINGVLYMVIDSGDYTFGLGVHEYKIIIKNQDVILLNKYSDLLDSSCDYIEAEDRFVPCWGTYVQIFTEDDGTEIVNLEPASKVGIPNSEMGFSREEEGSFFSRLMTQYSDAQKVFDFENNAMYKTEEGCFIARANDSTARYYYFDFGFFKTTGEDYKSYNATGILDVQWSDGEENTQEYRAGMYECYEYANYISNADQLVEIGLSGNGNKFYELKDKHLSALEQMYATYYPGYGQEKVSYEEFLSTHPLVLWQDPFGGFIQFKDIRYAPVAEMAKPAIYLYPEKETNVSVVVNPNGGLTFTDPEYKDGWMVKAKPNGEIYNYDDGEIYPYLFWEGKALDYKPQKQGFVVAKENIKEFLKEKLIKLGLIEKEYNEFIEFWLPKMQNKKYYFISFVGQKEIDDVAPLSISPKPDTIIRVLMDYQGLDEYKNIIEQKIITPERKGFIVVEWGGVLHK